jgi:5-methyltetrahydrofolate--homocysteine methyltransferase
MDSTRRGPLARPGADDAYLQALAHRVVIFDGATGTNLQLQHLSADDFGGVTLEGCNEFLVLSKPDAVETVHRSFLEVGVDAIETNSFGSFSVVLNEYGIGGRAEEMARTSAAIARRVADEYASPGSPRFVAGSMGPGTKFPTLGQITYDDLSASYEELAYGLLEGGVDLLLVETMFDLLSGKAAIAAAHRAMARHGRVVPIQVQVTIELTGRMLPGTEIGAAIAALSPLGIDVIGLNCATGPVEMYEPLRTLSDIAAMPISCMPNAGLPSVVEGQMHYDLTPDALAEHLARFVTEYGVQVVGGCCGTTPEHLARVIEAVRPLAAAKRSPTPEHGVASIYSPVSYQQDRSVLLIGERTNANGSKKFRDGHARRRLGHVRGDRARTDQRGRAHPGRLRRLHRRRRRGGHERTDEPSGDTVLGADHDRHHRGPVARQALTWLGGKPLLNSVNLEEGDGPGTRLDGFLSLAAEFGAAVVATCIDEEGQARTAEWKVRAARSHHRPRGQRYGLDAHDIFIDTLAFPSRRAWWTRVATASRPSRRFDASRPNSRACARSSGSRTSPSV